MNLSAYRLKSCWLGLFCFLAQVMYAQQNEPVKISRFEIHSTTATGVNGAYQLTGLQVRFANRLKWEGGVRQSYFSRPPIENQADKPAQPRHGLYTGLHFQLDRNLAVKGLQLFFKGQIAVANNYHMVDTTFRGPSFSPAAYEQRPTIINYSAGFLAIISITKWLGLRVEAGLASEEKNTLSTFTLNDRLKGGYLGLGIAIRLRTKWDLVAPPFSRW